MTPPTKTLSTMRPSNINSIHENSKLQWKIIQLSISIPEKESG